MTHELLVHLATWNVADQGPPPAGQLSLSRLVQLDSPVPPDVCIIGLQEVHKSSEWASLLAKELSKSDYVLVRSIQMQGIVLHVYVLRKHLPFVTNVETQYTRTAFNGLLGLKGAVSFRADLYGVNIITVNCHLPAYDEKFSERIENYNVIIEGQTFKDKDVENILDHDYVFWIGDLNFRLDDLSRDQIVEKVEKKEYEALLRNDQLCKARREELIFLDFEEGNIRFPPTYKFDIGTNVYDTGPKCRKPAWCDRILWMVHEDAFMELSGLQLLTTGGSLDPRLSVVQKAYTSIAEYQLSDHKPVAAQFIIKAFVVMPSVVFDTPEGWQCSNDGVVRYCVIGLQTSTWDYIALFKADFFTLDEYVTYVYASGKNDTTISGTAAVTSVAKFPASSLRDPGVYRLCYISSGKKFIRGMSAAFEVQPKYVLAPLPPLPEGAAKELVAVAAASQPKAATDATAGPAAATATAATVHRPPDKDVDIFEDPDDGVAVQERPAHLWQLPDASRGAAAEETKNARESSQQPAQKLKGEGSGGSSRIRPGMSIQELKLVSAEMHQEQQRKQSAMSVLLAKASKLSTRLQVGGSGHLLAPHFEEEESCELVAPASPGAPAVRVSAAADEGHSGLAVHKNTPSAPRRDAASDGLVANSDVTTGRGTVERRSEKCCVSVDVAGTVAAESGLPVGKQMSQLGGTCPATVQASVLQDKNGAGSSCAAVTTSHLPADSQPAQATSGSHSSAAVMVVTAKGADTGSDTTNASSSSSVKGTPPAGSIVADSVRTICKVADARSMSAASVPAKSETFAAVEPGNLACSAASAAGFADAAFVVGRAGSVGVAAPEHRSRSDLIKAGTAEAALPGRTLSVKEDVPAVSSRETAASGGERASSSWRATAEKGMPSASLQGTAKVSASVTSEHRTAAVNGAVPAVSSRGSAATEGMNLQGTDAEKGASAVSSQDAAATDRIAAISLRGAAMAEGGLTVMNSQVATAKESISAAASPQAAAVNSRASSSASQEAATQEVAAKEASAAAVKEGTSTTTGQRAKETAAGCEISRGAATKEELSAAGMNSQVASAKKSGPVTKSHEAAEKEGAQAAGAKTNAAASCSQRVPAGEAQSTASPNCVSPAVALLGPKELACLSEVSVVAESGSGSSSEGSTS